MVYREVKDPFKELRKRAISIFWKASNIVWITIQNLTITERFIWTLQEPREIIENDGKYKIHKIAKDSLSFLWVNFDLKRICC